jgi:hypothetical protein
VLIGCLALTGCGGGAPSAQPSDGGQVKPNPARTVTMNGRSVMEGWMKHWGFKWEGPVQKNGYSFDYKELDASELDRIAGSFANNVANLPPKSVVFFKFCFADFSGDNLRALEGIVDSVIQTARSKGLRLIVGNALPVRKQDGSPELVSEYKKYNAFLEEKARQGENLWIFGFYGVLAGSDGFLKSEYQTEDSHPNDRAYTTLDATFFPLLNAVFNQGHLDELGG